MVLLQDLRSEAESLAGQRDALRELSGTVLMFLEESSSASAAALSEKLKQLNESYER